MKQTIPSGYAFKQWLPVLSLSFAAFLFVTTEMMPIGLLPEIALSLGHSESTTGLILTVYAWCVALTSLPLIILTQRFERRKLFFAILLLFCVCHAAAGVSQSFTQLMLARLGIALCHAIFWAIATPLAARLAPKGAQARALALMVGGISLAATLGMPLGTLMGLYWGWRSAFWAIGVFGLVVWGVMAFSLPTLPSQNTRNFAMLPCLIRNKQIILVYCITACFVTGHFTAFSYLVPFFKTFASYTENTVVFLLLILGGSGALGGYLASRVAEKYPARSIVCCIIIIGGILLWLRFVSGNFTLLLAACVCWGASMSGLNLVLQMFILQRATSTADMAIAIYSGIFNVGIGGGAFIGSYIFDAWGVENVGFGGAIFLVAGLGCALYLQRCLRYPSCDAR